MPEFFRRVWFLLNRRRLERELADEMEAHREMSAANFGNMLRLREEARDAWGWTWIDRLLQDIRYSLRTLRKAPGFTAAAVLMLAVGVGVNVAAFGFFNVVMFRPLPVREPEQLLRFHRIAPNEYSSDLPYPSMVFYREHSRTLSAMLALDVGLLLGDGGEKPVRAYFVTGNFLSELGARAELGRFPGEAEPEPVAALSYDYWQSHFGGDPLVVGKTLRLNGRTVLISGVVSKDFSGLTFTVPDVWIPLTQQPRLVEGSRLLTSFSADGDGVDMWGRLRPGVTARAAQEEMRMLTEELRKQHPNDVWKGESLSTEPGGFAQNAGGKERGTGPAPGLRAKLLPVFALIGALTLLILAVTCGNVGSLLLARGVSREREMSIRTAIGAGKARLVRQLLTESLVLALAGSGAALAVGYLVLQWMLAWTDAPSWLDVRPDWRVIGFTTGLAVCSALLFGLTPALQMVRSFRRVTAARHFLIGAQVTASCVLLIVAGLLVRAIHHAVSDDPGFDYKQVISIDPRLGIHGYSAGAARGYLETLLAQLRSVPGAVSVALSVSPPLGNRTSTVGGEKDGRQFPIYFNQIDPEFFTTMRIPLLRGRNLHAGESDSVIVSESLARRMWPAEDPLTKQLEIGAAKRQVVGVAGNARANALADEDAVEAYESIGEKNLPSAAVLVRVAGPVAGVLQTVATTARESDARVAPAIQTLSGAFERKIEGTQRSAAAVSILGGVALLLACVGIGGVVSYAVSQRVKDVGIRMALGAMPGDILAVFLRQFWPPIVAGLTLGAGGGAALSQMLRGQLYGVSPLDPIAYVGAAVLLGLTAVAAVIVPAQRALRVDPLRALRWE